MRYGMVFAVFMLTLQVHAQITFERTYGGAYYDEGFMAKQTPDGGYIATGITYSYENGPKIFLVRTNPYGDTIWTRALMEASAHDLIIDEDEGYVLCGSDYTTSTDVLLVKTDQDGNILWTNTFGGGATERGNALMKTSDGGFIIVGMTESRGTQYRNIYLVKTDESGTLEWERAYSHLYISDGMCVAQDPEGNFLISGYTGVLSDQSTRGTLESVLLKTTINGDSLWMKTYPGETISSFAITPDTGYLLCSFTEDISIGEQQILLLRTNKDGDLLWSKTMELTAPFSLANRIEKTEDDDYILAGYTRFNQPTYEINGLLVKLTPDGDTIWTKTYGGDEADAFSSVQQTADEGYILCGYTISSGYGLRDLYLVKTNSEGVVTSVHAPATANGFRIYPNPAGDFVRIAAQQGIFQAYTITSPTGQILQSGEIPPSMMLPVGDLPSGFYFIQLMDMKGKRDTVLKMMKK